MRIKATNKLTMLVAMGVVMTTMMTAHLSTARTYAASSGQPVPASFHEVALQGFGDRANSWAWSMTWYKNRLYVGTNRNFMCSIQAMIVRVLPSYPYPPNDSDVLCPGTPAQAWDVPPSAGAEIWSADPSSSAALTQSNWTENYASPYTVSMTIAHHAVMGPRDIGFRGMSVYTDVDGTQSLYVSGIGLKPLGGPNVPPPSLLRSTDGATFQPVPADPGTTLGDINTLSTLPSVLGPYGAGGCCLRGQASFSGNFVVLIGGIQGAGAVFASPDPRQGDNSFQQITPKSMLVYEMMPFNGHLYIAVQSSGGYQVVRTDCTAPPPGQPWCPSSAFTQVVPPGAGLGAQGSTNVTSMHVFTDTAGVPHLYVGTDGTTGGTVGKPAELIRVNTDDSWDVIVGDPRTINGVVKDPLSGLPAGFGWPFNIHMWRMEDDNGVLYVGTNDESIQWKNTLLGSLLKPYMGFDLWASADGVHFMPVTQNGFGDMFSYGARSLTATPYGLFVGSANHYYGLRIWQGALTSSEVRRVPQNLQVEAATSQGAPALSWAASPGAALYHVYRSAETMQALPAPSNPDPHFLNKVELRSLPHAVWLPGAYTAIGTSNTPYFVDQSARAGGRYRYYVVAQDASGALTAPSNVASYPALEPPATVRAITAILAFWRARGKLTASQAGPVERAVQSADTRARAGDARGAYTVLDAARRHMLSSARGSVGRLYAGELALLLERLEQRVALVHGHVLAAARL